MYKTIEYFPSDGVILKDVLKECLYNYSQKKKINLQENLDKELNNEKNNCIINGINERVLFKKKGD